MYDKPIPITDPGTQPYWDALRTHRLLIKHCSICGKSHFYPRELCPYCHHDTLQWIDASGDATVYSYTVARRPAGPAFKIDTPYVLAIVELDEGPRMLTQLVGVAPEAAHIGARVRVAFDDVTPELTLPRFAPIVEG